MWSNGYSTGEYNFDNATEIFSVNQKGEKVDIDELLKECAEPEDDKKANESATIETNGAEKERKWKR